MSKIERRLPSAAVLRVVKSSCAPQPNQLDQSDVLLCLFHLLKPAIIFGLKKVTPLFNNYMQIGIWNVLMQGP